jgi:XcyI restriction endonuclease
MARSNASSSSIVTPDPSRQVSFHGLLAAARQTVLKDALHDALAEADPDEVKRELSEYVPRDAQKILARAGIRDEEVFPTPVVLKAKPTLVGYYRLLLGVSQKRFYATATGMGPMKVLEERGILKSRQEAMLPDFCKAMCEALAELVRDVSPGVTQRDVDELPLLTLGAQFQGSNNNTIGQVAIREVFLAIKEIVKDHIEKEDATLVVRNASGRLVRITQAADPDVRIEEEFGGEWRHTTAIEIKGGTDRSNAHNRAGEAEKSHQKARAAGFRDFWTIIAKLGLDIAVLQAESPTTNSWFDAAQVLARQGTDWTEFASRLAGAVGIPYS